MLFCMMVKLMKIMIWKKIFKHFLLRLCPSDASSHLALQISFILPNKNKDLLRLS